jgi:hypothetical protein
MVAAHGLLGMVAASSGFKCDGVDAQVRQLWQGRFWRGRQEEEDDGTGGSTPVPTAVFILAPLRMPVAVSPQQICHNGSMPVISRDDLAGCHANSYIRNGSIGDLIL